MVPSCLSHLLEPLGLYNNVLKFIRHGENTKAAKATLKTEEYAATKRLNFLPGIRTFGAFFAHQQSNKYPFPGKNDGTKLRVTSCEYPELLRLDWPNKGVAERLAIFNSEDAKEDTLDGSYCHRIDFHQRFKQSS